jgi:hypothetical protein
VYQKVRCLNIILQETAEYSRIQPSDNTQIFSDVYHAMVHSPALETLLNLEHKFAWDTRSVIDRRNDEISQLERRCVVMRLLQVIVCVAAELIICTCCLRRQESEMMKALSEVGHMRTDSDITLLAQKHLEAMEVYCYH